VQSPTHALLVAGAIYQALVYAIGSGSVGSFISEARLRVNENAIELR
jgi:tRNA A37 threonylcarbamoyladenosine dehydratase